MNKTVNLAAIVVATTVLSGCIGANALVVPVTRVATEAVGAVASTGIDAVKDSLKGEEEPKKEIRTAEDMLAMLHEACEKEGLSEVTCKAKEESALKAYAMMERMRALNRRAEAQRAESRKDYWSAGSVIGRVASGVAGQAMIGPQAAFATKMHTAIR